MPKIDLASQRMSTGGGPGGLSPVQISAAAGGQIRAPHINVNAANVQYSNMAVPEIDTNPNIIQQIAAAGSSMAKAAFDRSERQAQADADQATIDFNNAVSDLFYGRTDEDGNLVQGFKDSQGEDALNSAKQYIESVNAMYEQYMGGLSHSARAKATLRLTQGRNIALNRGAQHQASQLKVREDNIRYEENMSIRKAISINPTEPWANGTVDEHLKKYKTQQERDAARGALATHTLYDSFNRAYENTGSPTGAYQAAKNSIEPILDTLDADSANTIRYKLNQMRDASERQEKSEAAANLKQGQQILNQQAPQQLVKTIQQGVPANLKPLVEEHRKYYPDLDDQTKAVISHAKSALMNIANNPSNINTEAKVRAAQQEYAIIQQSGAYTKGELMQLGVYAKATLPYELAKQQDKADAAINAQYSGELIRQIEEGQAISPSFPPNEMNQEGKDVYSAIQADMIALQKEGLTATQDIERRGFKTAFEAKHVDGTLSVDDLPWINGLAKKGKIGADQYLYAMELLGKQKASRGKKEPYKLTPEYKVGLESIKKLKSMNFFVGGEKIKTKKLKDPDKAREQTELNLRNEKGYQDMLVAYDAAVKADPNLNTTEWVQDYIKEENEGSILGSFWKTVFKTAKDIVTPTPVIQ